MRNQSVKWLATGFGLGLAPKAPGTFGTLLGIPLALGLYLLGPTAYVVGTFAFVLFSIFIAELYERDSGSHDSKEVVIDEVAGFLISMALLPMNILWITLSFVLFRILDATKPPPIRQLDQKVTGGFGVVIDDVVAGIITNLILQVVFQTEILSML
ncbi:MAG: phosphatidylglycerophosphatase A [Bdellovibrionales bacterium]|nr:phosphatidylglycerophosphatase A [Bdellovibrionales bacterium]